MDDRQLDELLGRMDPVISPAAEREAVALARASFKEPKPRTWTPRRVAVATTAAAFVLTAGGGSAAYLLSIPPFQSLDHGLTRTVKPIPLNATTDNGLRFECSAFIETRGASNDQLDAIDAMITTTDWSGYGQGLYDALPDADRDGLTSAPGILGDVAGANLTKRAAAVTGLSVDPFSEASVTGYAIHCTYPDGNP